MDEIFKAVRHVGHLARRFPAALQVDNIGYIRSKSSWIKKRFQSYNFSFILQGGGEYWRDGVCLPVNAPCVITQDPDHYLEYGPTGACQAWEELYIIYNRDKRAPLERMGLFRPDVCIWQIRDPAPVRAKLEELRKLAGNCLEAGNADRIDRGCELLVMESILAQTCAPLSREELAIQQIRDQVRDHFLDPHDFHLLARRHGFSVSTFRRRWAEQVGVPPARYVQQLRIREACRMLVETRRKIGEIAALLRFKDPLYFSRRFRLETGVTAAEYRRLHQALHQA